MSLQQDMREFFKQMEIPSGVRIIVSRQDGIQMVDTHKDNLSQSLSALCAGSWEASWAMLKTMRPRDNFNDYRFCFDTSSHGVLILPFPLKNQIFYIAGIYDNALNPALLKRKIQNLKIQLVNQLEKKINSSSSKLAEIPVNENYLFTDITDEEMDRLFGL